MLAWTGPAEEDREALANAREIPSSMSPYPSPGVYAPYEAPKKKHDTIAEAWGIHEPEPFQAAAASVACTLRCPGAWGNTARSREAPSDDLAFRRTTATTPNASYTL